MSDPLPPIAIEAKGLGKTYRIYHGQGRGFLKSLLFRKRSSGNHFTEIPALRDVDLTISRGEVIGIVGRNGAGKSTLLKVISGLTRPTHGTLVVHGQVRALLSLGIGFHPAFTGRENIIFGSLSMGIPKRLARERLEGIADFAELGPALDRPLQSYSTGMSARLAIAVAFQAVPDVLIIDEALAAGDGRFVVKCQRRIEEICSSGSTVLLVSHGTSIVERLCTRALIMEEGRIIDMGLPGKIVAHYNQILNMGVTAPLTSGPVASEPLRVSGTGAIEILEAGIRDAANKEASSVGEGSTFHLHIRFRTRVLIPGIVRFFAHLFAEDSGIRLAEIGPAYHPESGDCAWFYLSDLDGEYELTLTLLKNPLGGGTYSWDLFFAPEQMAFESSAEYHASAHRVARFRSVSFPNQSWGGQRRAVLEPQSRFNLQRIDAPSNGLPECGQPVEDSKNISD